MAFTNLAEKPQYCNFPSYNQEIAGEITVLLQFGCWTEEGALQIAWDRKKKKKALAGYGHWKQPEGSKFPVREKFPAQRGCGSPGSLHCTAWDSPRSHPPKAVWTLSLRLHEEQKWQVTCPWTEYSVLWTSDAGFTSAFRKWLWVYRFDVGDACRSLRSVQINLFGCCHFIGTESHKPHEETNPVLGCLFTNVIFHSYCWHSWPVYSYRR